MCAALLPVVIKHPISARSGAANDRNPLSYALPMLPVPVFKAESQNEGAVLTPASSLNGEGWDKMPHFQFPDL